MLLLLVSDNKTNNITQIGWYRYKFQNNKATMKNSPNITEVIIARPR